MNDAWSALPPLRSGSGATRPARQNPTASAVAIAALVGSGSRPSACDSPYERRAMGARELHRDRQPSRNVYAQTLPALAMVFQGATATPASIREPRVVADPPASQPQFIHHGRCSSSNNYNSQANTSPDAVAGFA